jgi:hypothetical protein
MVTKSDDEDDEDVGIRDNVGERVSQIARLSG